MTNIKLLFLLSLLIVSCKNETEKIDSSEPEDIMETRAKDYPASINKVFDAHGGLNTWEKMETLKFTIPQDEGVEQTTTDLKDRYSLIETDNFKLGFDGNEAWIDQDSTYFKNDPKFYHNLMFYFYAMPFVLADDGIIYSEVEPLMFEGKSYPGIMISYSDGVGASSDDEYILYYNPDTHKMEWLGYTVTYFSKEKSKDFHYIRYNEWQENNGLVLPKVLQWYKVENDSITTMRNEVKFENVKLMSEKMPQEMFMDPNNE